MTKFFMPKITKKKTKTIKQQKDYLENVISRMKKDAITIVKAREQFEKHRFYWLDHSTSAILDTLNETKDYLDLMIKTKEKKLAALIPTT